MKAVGHAILGCPNCQKCKRCHCKCVWTGPVRSRSESGGCSPPGGNMKVPLLTAQHWHSFKPSRLGKTTLEKDWSTETSVTETLRLYSCKANAVQALFTLIPISRCSDEARSNSFHEAGTCPLENGLWPPTLAHKLLSNHLMVTRETPEVCAGDLEVKWLSLSVWIPEAFRPLIRGEVLI